MSKLRSDSNWNQLTPEQRETAEGWLFDENLGFAQAAARIAKEFGVAMSTSSVRRFYWHRARELQKEEFLDAQEIALEVNELPLCLSSQRQAMVKLLYKNILKLALEKPGEVEVWASLTKTALASEDMEIRWSHLRLAERRFDFEATAAAQKELPQLRTLLTDILEDPNLSQDEKNERVHALLYGWNRGNGPAAPPDQPKNGT